MIQIADLEIKGEALQCKHCLREFECSRRELSDPDRLMAKKDRIAGLHVCGKQRKRMFKLPDTKERAISNYFDREIRRSLQA